MADFILSAKGINKSFAATRANRDISLDIPRGCVFGLAGENGSGKSTLASILCGIQQKDSGEILLDGKPYHPKNPLEANDAGVAMVVQELGVVGGLPPSVNMFLGRTGRFAKGGLVSPKKMRAAAQEQLDRWELGDVPLDGVAESLSIENRKLIELARALSIDPDFLVLDEISQALSHDNRKMLVRFIHRFVEQGKTILFITHDLDELIELSDHIAVLRDGQLVATRERGGVDVDEIKRLMIGREIEGDYYRADSEERYEDEVVLRAENLCVPGQLEDISFELHRGEILGVCGLSDAGIHDLGTAVFGLAEHRTGDLTFVPESRALRSTRDVINTGGAYLSKDRDAYGLMLNASIYANLSVPNALELSGPMAFLSPRRLRQLAEQAAADFDIKAVSIDQVTKSLSGGNKQKVNLSRWLSKDLRYIILDCPTRGVDVGVKAYIYKILAEAKERGLAILLITDELSEAMGMADRILVLREHRGVATLSRNGEFTENNIVEVML